MQLSTIGNISLNSSFFLYLILYLPQVIHNRKTENLAQLSLWLHLLLFVSYLFDLCYGFSNQLPWQYKTVSIIGLTLISIQHMQLLVYFYKSEQLFWVHFNIICLVIAGMGLFYFFNRLHGIVSEDLTVVFGTLARALGLLYSVPQIIKNKKSLKNKALSIHFLYLNLTLACLDLISSWCLDWGWPNKLAAPFTIIMMSILINQARNPSVNLTYHVPDTVPDTSVI